MLVGKDVEKYIFCSNIRGKQVRCHAQWFGRGFSPCVQEADINFANNPHPLEPLPLPRTNSYTVQHFYTNLCREERTGATVTRHVLGALGVALTERDRLSWEGLPVLEHLLVSVQQLNFGKSSCLDGLPIECYRYFFTCLMEKFVLVAKVPQKWRSRHGISNHVIVNNWLTSNQRRETWCMLFPMFDVLIAEQLAASARVNPGVEGIVIPGTAQNSNVSSYTGDGHVSLQTMRDFQHLTKSCNSTVCIRSKN